MQSKLPLHLAAIGVMFAALIPVARAQEWGWEHMPADMHQRATWLADRTSEDLRHFVHRENLDPHERERLDAALTHLHAFRESMGAGRYEREHLDRAIENIEGVMEHANLGEHERAELGEDVHRLRDLRDHWHA